jgi:hypothetical protein
MMPAATTRASLWRLLFALVAAALAVLASTAWVFQGTRSAATTVQDRAVPSVMHVLAARAALVDADAAAIESFRTGGVRLTGPGERYQNSMAVAGQSLTQLAQDSTAGAGADQTIQLVEGLVVAYVGLIEQADAHFRQEAGSAVGTADLWYASRLLHMPAGGILAQLDGLRDAESHALAGRADAPHWPGVWILPVLLLLALLIAGQVFLSRTFHRTLNPALVAATLVVLAAAGVMAVDLAARHELHAARDATTQAAGVWRARADATDRAGQSDLAALVKTACPACATPASAPVPAAATPDDRQLAGAVKAADRHAAAAAGTATGQLGVALLALLALALVPVGLYPRLDEYR